MPDAPEAISINKAGSEIWVGSNDDEVVTVVATSDGAMLAQWTDFEWPYRILLTDDERYAIIPDLSKHELRFFDAQAKTELGSIDLSGMRPEGLSLYSDDRTLFIALAQENKVLAIDIESREILGEYATGSGPDGIGFSPLVLR